MASPEIQKLLEDYNSSTLVQMAGFLSVLPKQQKGKSILIPLIEGVITDPSYIRETIKKLSQGERAALDAILRREGKASVRGLRADLFRQGLIDPKVRVEFGEYSTLRPDPRAENSRRLEDILARLMIRGLVFSDDAPDLNLNPYGQKRTFHDAVQKVTIPPAMRRHLPEPPPVLTIEQKLPELKTVQEGSARVFQRELYLYWSYLRDHLTSVTLKGEISKQALKDINSILMVREEIKTGKTENDYPRLRFLRGMLAELKLTRERLAGGIETVPGEFFTLAPAERVRRTYQAWLETSQFNELLLLPDEVRPRGTTSNPLIPARPGLVKARKFIVERFRKLKPTDWVLLQTLIDLIYDQDYEFLLARREYAGYYGYSVANPYEYASNDFFLTFPKIMNEEEGWQKVEANLIRGTVFGPLYWMGLVDLGWPGKEEGAPAASTERSSAREEARLAAAASSGAKGPLAVPAASSSEEARLAAAAFSGDEARLAAAAFSGDEARLAAPAAFRLTPLGAWVLGLGPQPEIPVEGGRVIVQPTLQIMALDPIQDAVLANLDRFAVRISAERAVEYRLTRASVYAAQQAGWDAAQIKSTLEQYSSSELPPNVARTLDEWQAQFERIVIHPKVTLAHGDPQAIDLLASAPAMAGWITMRPLPELALLKNSQAIPKVTSLLRSREILPVLNANAAVQPNAVMVSETGELRINGRIASLYLHGYLSPFANPIEAGYQVTPDSVQRAVRSGIAATEILKRLEAVHSGPLPEKLARSIRAWAGHYGSAALESVLLLQVRDEAVLKELLEDPEVGPLIRRFTPQPRALAQVKPENLEKLRALLAERGVDLAARLK